MKTRLIPPTHCHGEILVKVSSHGHGVSLVVVELWVVGVAHNHRVVVAVVKELVHAVWGRLYV